MRKHERRQFWLEVAIVLGWALLLAAVMPALFGCEPVDPPDPTGPITADGQQVDLGERYSRTYLMRVARNQGDPQYPDDHIVRVWTGMVASSVELVDGVWMVSDTRFGTPIVEKASEIWKSKEAMMDALRPYIIPDPPPPGPDPDWGPYDGVPPDWPDIPEAWKINPDDFR